MQERENILRIFKETKEAISKCDFGKIGLLSNQTTNTASLTNDPDNIAAAVVVFALSKILENQDCKKLSGWDKFWNTCMDSIERIIESIGNKNDEEYRKNIEIIRMGIGRLSGKLKEYIKEVFRNASINKASRIHEHGISMERTARLLGITLYELSAYMGENKTSNEISQNQAVDIKTRIKYVEDIFA